jgi:hypothetical protein
MIMKKAVFFATCLCLFSGLNAVYPQTDKTKLINQEYVDLDLKGIRAFAKLRLPEYYGLQILKKKFGLLPAYAGWTDEKNLGFGARRLKLNKGLGSVTAYIDLLVFRGRIGYYQLGLDIHGSELPPAEILAEWRKSGGPPLVLKNETFIRQRNFGRAWSDYKSVIAQALGPMQPVRVTDNLKESYTLLTNPLENSRISFVACDDGKPAIDKLEDAARIDLIENVLRGYNPGGRIYAAISLLRLERSGKKLNSGTKSAIKRVVNLDAEVETCRGDTGIFGLTARDIVPEYVSSNEWYLLRK